MNEQPTRPSHSPPDGDSQLPAASELDPVYLHSIHEGRIILGAWAVCLVWSLGVCSTMGYEAPSETISVTLGAPSWVFWGIVLPWVMVSLFSVWFSLFYMKNDDLGPNTDDQPEADSANTGESAGEGRHA